MLFNILVFAIIILKFTINNTINNRFKKYIKKNE